MNNGFDRIVVLFAAYCLSVIVAGTSLLQVARGQEVLPPPVFTLPGAHSCQALIVEPGPGKAQRIVIFSNVPLVGHVFQSSCHGPTGCEEMLQRVGAEHDREVVDQCRAGDINVHVFGDLSRADHTIVFNRLTLQPGDIIDARGVRNSERRITASQLELDCRNEHAIDHAETFLRLGCPFEATGQCTCDERASCASECAAANCDGCKCDPCECPDCQCDWCAGKSSEATCGEDCAVRTLIVRHAEHHDIDEIAEHDPLRLMQHIARLMAEKAAAEAALEVREESAEQLSELFEAMAELIADNAALDARLQAQTEHTRLLEKMSDLAAENARLKAHVELANERMELTKATLSMTLENERLKFRVAELEQQQANGEAARTAAGPRSDRKSR